MLKEDKLFNVVDKMINPRHPDNIKVEEELIQKITDEVHIKWLSKAYTCKCKTKYSNERTSINYGFLSQAVEEALKNYANQQKGE